VLQEPHGHATLKKQSSTLHQSGPE
jgi:hypothetical protein